MEDQLLFKDENGVSCFKGSISWGTLNPRDLFRRFHEEARRRQLLTPDQEYYGDIICDVADGDSIWVSERISELIDEMEDDLGQGLPEGIYFGTIEGDGSDFGYWTVQDV